MDTTVGNENSGNGHTTGDLGDSRRNLSFISGGLDNPKVTILVYDLVVTILLIIALYSYRLEFYQRKRVIFIIIPLYILFSVGYMFLNRNIVKGKFLSSTYLIGFGLLLFDLSASLIYYRYDTHKIDKLKNGSLHHKLLYFLLKIYDVICDHELMEVSSKIIRFFTGSSLLIIKIIYIVVIIIYICNMIVGFYKLINDNTPA